MRAGRCPRRPRPPNRGRVDRLWAMALGRIPTRRQFLASLGIGILAAACGKSKSPISPTAPATSGEVGSLNYLARGAQQVSVLASNSAVNPGASRFAFDLTTRGNQFITGGSPQVWLAKDAATKAVGPFSATWWPLTAYDITHDTSPNEGLPGTYAADLDIPSSGNWFVGVTVESGSTKAFGSAALPATDGPIPAPLGSKAKSVATPVATTDAKIAQICTRKPVDHMHYISLADALRNGKPTVVSFATPLLCESRLCGPVVDEQILASQSFGSKANFIHVEEFLPGPDLKPPAPTLANQSPGFKAWSFSTEPWVVVIDRAGVVRARFEGPVTSPQIEA